MITHVWKILQDLSPNYISMVFKESPILGKRVVMPPLDKQNSALAKSCYNSSFVVRAGKFRNLLPREVENWKDLIFPLAYLSTLFLTLLQFPDT